MAEHILGLERTDLFHVARACFLTDGIYECQYDDYNEEHVIENFEANLATSHALDVSRALVISLKNQVLLVEQVRV